MLLEISVILVVMLTLWIVIAFGGWRISLLSSLEINSLIAETSHGVIEYALQGNGPVVLLLHGAPGGYDQGLLDQELWTGEGFSVLSVSRPGYLQTPIETGVTFEEQADAIDALLTTLNIAQVAVVGASAGGPVALHLALRHPGRVGALVLIAAVSKAYHVRESQKQSLLGRIFLSDIAADLGVWFFDILTRHWPSRSLKEMFKENVCLSSKVLGVYVKEVISNPTQVDWYKRFIRTTCPMSSRLNGLNNDLEQLEAIVFDNLDEITCPTLVIHGTADNDVSFSNAEYSAAAIPNSRLYTLDGVGHVVWLGKHVSKMNSDLVKFLQEVYRKHLDY